MKKKLLFLFLPLLSVLLVSAYKKKVLPPGTVELSEGYYMDKMQISNAAWKEYVYWNKRTFGDSSVEYQTSKINSQKNMCKHTIRNITFANTAVAN